MTKEDIENIVDERIDLMISCNEGFIRVKPTMKTIEVAKFLNRSRDWVIDRKAVLRGKRVNKRGDFVFDTDKVIQYRINQKHL